MLSGLATYETSDPDGEDGTLAYDPAAFAELLAFLAASDLEAAQARFRSLLSSPDEHVPEGVAAALIQLRDVDGLPQLEKYLRSLPPGARPMDQLACFPHPRIRDLLIEWSDDPSGDDSSREQAFLSLAKQLDEQFSGGADRFLSWNAAREALLRGDLATFRLLYDASPRHEETWARIGLAAVAGDVGARAGFWSALRTARYRWFHYEFDEAIHTLGGDPSVLPHWAMDLDSNCCRISDGMAIGVFEHPYGVPHIYDRHRFAVARPASEFVRDWMAVHAGRFVRTAISEERYGSAPTLRFTPEPE